MGNFIDELLSQPLTAKNADKLIERILEESVRRHARTIYLISTRSSFVLKLRFKDTIERVHHFSADDRKTLLYSLSRMAQAPETQGELFEDLFDEPWGRITRQIDENIIDFRVTFLPCELGKDVAIQVTYPDSSVHELEEVYRGGPILRALRRELAASYGMYVVAGPPFSGKSTTAWAMLEEMNTETNHIISVESPIRRLVPGVSQIEVQADGSPDYVDALQAVRYHQPDAVYLDSVEDDLVLQEALRTVHQGYRVVANMSTGDVAETLAYLRDLRDSPRSMYRALRVIVAQRLLPIVPAEHRAEIPAPDWLAEHPALNDLPEPAFIESDADGVAPDGRLPVLETLIIDEEVRQFLKRGPNEEEIREYLTNLEDFVSLRTSALRLAASGQVALSVALAETPPDLVEE